MKTICPTDTAFYDRHETDALLNLFERVVGDGATIAMNHGAEHPMAVENLRMAEAIAGQLMERGAV